MCLCIGCKTSHCASLCSSSSLQNMARVAHAESIKMVYKYAVIVNLEIPRAIEQLTGISRFLYLSLYPILCDCACGAHVVLPSDKSNSIFGNDEQLANVKCGFCPGILPLVIRTERSRLAPQQQSLTNVI